MNQSLCLLAVFEVESSKSWGVEQSQTKPTAPYTPSPSPLSLSNAKHIHSLTFVFWYHFSLSPFVLCSVCWQWSVSLLMALSVAVFKYQGDTTRWVLYDWWQHIWKSYIYHREWYYIVYKILSWIRWRRQFWFWRAALSLVLHDKIPVFRVLHKLCHKHAQWLKWLQDHLWWCWLCQVYVSV